jgi:phosphocarrier protein HPr
MLKQEIKIINKLGLHARASSKFTQTAAQFSSEVWVTRKERRVNGKSIMGLDDAGRSTRRHHRA